MSGVQWRRRGVTLTEMLAVVAIMMILSVMAVGGFLQRVHLARVKRANAEARQIAEAEIQCAAIHGYFVPIQVLDDVMDVPGDTLSRDDTINNEPISQIYLIDPHVPSYLQQGRQLRLFDIYNTRIRRMRDNWQGPFLRVKDVYIGDASTDDPEDLAAAGIPSYWDFPLDPWGQPYRMYSPLGIVGTNAQDANNFGSNFSDGLLRSFEDRFDRFAIVSFGPDQRSDYGRTEGNDDIIYSFGFTFSETTYNKF